MTGKQEWFKTLMEDLVLKGFGQMVKVDGRGCSYEVDVFDPGDLKDYRLEMKLTGKGRVKSYSLYEDSSLYGSEAAEHLRSKDWSRFQEELLRVHLKVGDYLAKKKLGMETPELISVRLSPVALVERFYSK